MNTPVNLCSRYCALICGLFVCRFEVTYDKNSRNISYLGCLNNRKISQLYNQNAQHFELSLLIRLHGKF